MRSALEKAPGLVAPSWLTMQSAMAGGAAGGAAAASWRWIIGPAAGAALIGGALWFNSPNTPDADAPVVGSELESADRTDGVEAAELSDETAQMDGTVSTNDVAGESATEPLPAPVDEVYPLPTRSEPARDVEEPTIVLEEPTAGPYQDTEDWADLPVEVAAAFGVDLKETCVGAEIGFRMAKPMEDVRVLWNFGDGQFSSDPNPQHVFKASGTYDITLSVTRVSDGLIRTRTIENLVTIHPNPEAEFTWEVPGRAKTLPEVKMRNRSSNAASSTWVIDGEVTQSGEIATFELERVGQHVVQLVASSAHGCQSVASHTIEVGNRFGIGGAGRFSPDGDGHYDTFMPQGLAKLEAPFVFRVEDGDGHIVFETVSVAPWDGQLPDGRMATSGESYAWSLVIQGEHGPTYFSDNVLVE
ncbi:MAG: PKD domain-containing protein [Flavobacteriales bacterium]|nr:PKD domain-containing protein [Flavobacteriales bacterium]